MRGSCAGLNLLVLVVSTSGCIRSVSLPAEGEGGFVSGRVVERDFATEDLVGSANVQVRALGTSASVASGDNGFFQLSRLPLDKVRVSLKKRGRPGQPELARLLDPIRILADGQDVGLGDVRLLGDGALEGIVRRSEEPGGAVSPASGAVVVLAQTSFKAIAETEGGFLVTRLPQGTVDVVAFLPGYVPAIVPGVTVVPGTQTRVRPIVLEAGPTPPQSVSGRARKADTTEHGGITVRWIDEQTGTEAATATTDETGAYTVTALPVGVYRVRYEAEGYGVADIPGVAVLPEAVIGLIDGYLIRFDPDDIDGDGIPNAMDPDRDGDGCSNEEDRFPDDPTYCLNSDAPEDDLPDEIDPDDDNDGLSDAEELSLGRDGFLTDPLSPDTDDDGVDDFDDNCPTVANDQTDSNGNGIGDLCEGMTTMTSTAPPTFSGFSPMEGIVGTTVTITGAAFVPDPRLNLVSFNGGFALALSATETELRVQVPSNARTGLITVFSGVRTPVDSPGVFTFFPPPTIVDFEPRAVLPADLVAVYGRDFLTNPQVAVGAVAADVDAMCPSEIQSIAAGRGLEVICIRPTPASSSGHVTVTTMNGSSSSATELGILEGPQIVGFTLDPAPPDAITTILGRGFDVGVGQPAVTVLFSGTAAAVTPIEISDTAVSVRVPTTGAITGPVTVVHPAGDAVSPYPLRIENGQPAIVDFVPNPAMAGDTLTITGANLAAVDQVTFGGGASAAPSAASAGQVMVTVPAGIDPGPVTLGFSDATPDFTPMLRLMVIEQTSNTIAATGAYLPGLAYTTGGDVLALTNTEIVTIDANLTGATTQPLGVGNAEGLVASSSGEAGLVLGQQLNGAERAISIVSLPNVTVLGTCTVGFGVTNEVPTLSLDGRYLYSANPAPSELAGATAGILRIDFDTATCSVLGPTTGRDYGYGVAIDGSNLIIHARAQASPGGLAKMNVDPRDAIPDGTYVAPFGSLNSSAPPCGLSPAQLLGYLARPSVIYSFCNAPAVVPVSALPIAGGATRLVGTPSLSVYGVPSLNSRWVVRRSGTTASALYDLQNERIARNDLPPIDERSATRRRIGTTFYYRSPNTTQFHRIEIRE